MEFQLVFNHEKSTTENKHKWKVWKWLQISMVGTVLLGEPKHHIWLWFLYLNSFSFSEPGLWLECIKLHGFIAPFCCGEVLILFFKWEAYISKIIFLTKNMEHFPGNYYYYFREYCLYFVWCWRMASSRIYIETVWPRLWVNMAWFSINMWR